jgi:hypothetical protein
VPEAAKLGVKPRSKPNGVDLSTTLYQTSEIARRIRNNILEYLPHTTLKF